MVMPFLVGVIMIMDMFVNVNSPVSMPVLVLVLPFSRYPPDTP
jgi:hypothetical protein